MAGLAYTFAASSTACSGKKNTELVIAIQTDMRIPKDLDAVTLEIADQNGNQFVRQSFLVGPNGLHLPATIGVVAKSPSDVIDVIVTGQFGDLYPEDKLNHAHVVRRARFSFAEGRTGLVQMPLRFSCYDFGGACSDGQTCVAGVCKVVSTVDGASLPEFTPDKVYGSGSNGDGVGGKCWDPVTCLQANVALAKSHDDEQGNCYFPIGSAPTDGLDAGGGSGGDLDAGPRADGGTPFKFKSLDPTKPLNVFMVLTDKNHGFCDESGTCRVALDQDLEEGWHYDDSKTNVVLPRGLCTKIAAGARLEASDACETKVPSLPLCDVDSKIPVGGGTSMTDSGVEPDAAIDSGMGGDPDASIDTSVPPSDGGAGMSCGPVDPAPTSDPMLAGFSFLPTNPGMDDVSGTMFTGAVPSVGPGPGTCPGNEADFSGTNYMQGTLTNLSSTTNAFTISYWIKTGASLPPNQIVLTNNTGSTGFELGFNASGQPYGTAQFTGGPVTVSATSLPITAGWHHVEVQWMGIGQPVRAYIDNFLVASSPTPSGNFKPNTSLTIGRTATVTPGNFLTLPIGDLRIYGH